MKEEYYTPNVVDFAYQIVAMHKANQHLRHELEHYKEMHEIHCKTINTSIKNSEKMTGLILDTIIDPESAINKGHEAKLREELKI